MSKRSESLDRNASVAQLLYDGDLGALFEAVNWALIPPAPDFDEAAYLARHQDVAEEVRRGAITSGFEHFVRWGRSEGRERASKRD